MQGAKVTLLKAVAAGHATGIVNLVGLEVDAGGLAVLGAQAAGLALIGIKIDLKPRETRQLGKNGTHRADGVAIGAAATPCQHGDDNECRQGNEEGGQALHPHIHAVECVAIHPLGHRGQQVVAPLINGQQQIGHHEDVRISAYRLLHLQPYQTFHDIV